MSVRDVTLSYGRETIFSGLNGEFPAGRVTALVGPSGSGKSSLLSAVAGYRRLDAGQIKIASSEGPSQRPSPDLVAWIPQGSNALSRRTVIDNVLIAALASGADLDSGVRISEQALLQVGLLDKGGVSARTLSGGELQRVSIARALASGKPLILADEPSANLDAKSTFQVAETLSRIATSSTVIVATHDPILVEAAGSEVHIRRPS